jgi:hypothetical protein
LLQIAEQVNEGEREAYRRLAFVGWQLSGAKKTFPEYVQALGLGDRPEVDVADVVSAEQALERSGEILAMFRH